MQLGGTQAHDRRERTPHGETQPIGEPGMTPMTWFLALNVLDILLTLYVLKHGGSEKNPLLAKWFTLDDDPEVVMLRIKVLLLSFVWLAFYFGALPIWALIGLVVGYAGLALHNIRVVLRVLKRIHN